MPSLRVAILAFSLASLGLAATAAHADDPAKPADAPDEDNDGLPGARVGPTRAEIEALIRAIGREPVSPELVDAIDALHRPRWVRPSGFGRMKQRATDPEVVALIDEIARDRTGKPASTRLLLTCVSRIFNHPDRATFEAKVRATLAADAGPKLTIRGRVDDQDGHPIAGAVVSCRDALTRTDRRGDYVLKIPRPEAGEEFGASVEAPGFALAQTYFLWKDAAPESETRDVRLWKAAPFAGRVTDPDGKPIAGVLLELMTSDAATCRDGSYKTANDHNFYNVLEAKTDADGRYAFRNVPPELPDRQAFTHFTASHPKYQTREKVYAENEAIGTGWEIAMEPGCVATGTLVDPAGKPIAGASVSVARVGPRSGSGEPRATTGPDGTFRFDNLPEGDYKFVIRPPAHPMVIASAEVKPGRPTDLKLAAEEGAWFAGKVIGEDGKPAKNAMVGWIEPIDKDGKPIDPEFYLGVFSRTKEDGTFRVGPVQKGRRYRITGLVEPPRAEGKVEAETDGKPIVLELKPDRR